VATAYLIVLAAASKDATPWWTVLLTGLLAALLASAISGLIAGLVRASAFAAGVGYDVIVMIVRPG
jgi:hypothetical protein